MRCTNFGALSAGRGSGRGRCGRAVGVGGHLPAAEVDGFQARLHHLHRLIASQCTQRIHVVILLHQAPQPLGPHAGQGILDLNAAAQTQTSSLVYGRSMPCHRLSNFQSFFICAALYSFVMLTPPV
jgi:hypothetical protein